MDVLKQKVVALLSPSSEPDAFPEPARALAEPDGLLAIGGDLSVGRLLAAYRKGIFPWYSGDEPILWWSPSERMVFSPTGVHISRRFRRALRNTELNIVIDDEFEAVMRACAAPRPRQRGTWITEEMIDAYVALSLAGHAHSLSVYQGSVRIGGIYGVALGRMFFAESMFSSRNNGSKFALVYLSALLHALDFKLIDAQLPSPHLERMGGVRMPRSQFVEAVAEATAGQPQSQNWQAFCRNVQWKDLLAGLEANG